jgi:hypothetical protein
VVGEQFEAELAFYPARQPLRAVIAERKSADEGDDGTGEERATEERATEERASESGVNEEMAWPVADGKPLDAFRDTLRRAPWTSEMPMLLASGRIAQAGSGYWWQSEDGSCTLPLAGTPAKHIASVAMQQTAALWDGMTLTLLSAQSDWGRLCYGQ